MANPSELLAHRVRLYLKFKRTSQAALARAMGITPQHLCSVLTGHKHLTTTIAAKLAEATGMSLAELLPFVRVPEQRGPKRSGG